MALGYAPGVGLVACPFCREMFEHGEEVKCPVCGMKLEALEKLPMSHDAATEDGVPTMPETEVLPLTYLGRGKGILAALGLAGIVLFFAPWIRVTFPDAAVKTCADLSQRLIWSWAVVAAWMVLVPTVISRRSIVKMRGARVAAACLSAMPGVAAVNVLLHPMSGPVVRGLAITYHYTHGWGLYGTLAVSAIATYMSLFRLGGRMDDIKVRRGSSVGHELH
jgi:hypothetical protein